LGGEIRLDPRLASAAIDRLAAEVGLDRQRMAEGVIAIVVAKMTASIKEISIMRGHDPRDFALFAYGGAGPLHAALVAEELGCRRVLVPPLPGNFSAYGLLVADVRHDYARTRITPTAALSLAELTAILDGMREEGRNQLADEGFATAAMRFEARLDMRFIGQAFELSVPVPENGRSIEDIDRAFLAEYERRYSYAAAGAAEIVTFRVSAYGLVGKPELPRAPAGGSLQAAKTGERPVVFTGEFRPTATYDRARLPAGAEIAGPAIIEEAGSTSLVPPGFHARVDPYGTLVLERR
jgi:N-methylhydantoinase A